MMADALKRLGGLSGIVAGALLAIIAVADQALHVARIGTVPLVAALFNTLCVVSGIFALLALTVLYAHQSDKAGSFGVIGYVGAFTGWTLMTAYSYASAYAIPAFMREAPALRTAGSLSPLTEATVATVCLFVVGNLLFAISSHRAAVFARRSTVLLMVGSVLLLVPLLWGAAVIWMCIQLIRSVAPPWTPCSSPLSTSSHPAGVRRVAGQWPRRRSR